MLIQYRMLVGLHFLFSEFGVYGVIIDKTRRTRSQVLSVGILNQETRVLDIRRRSFRCVNFDDVIDGFTLFCSLRTQQVAEKTHKSQAQTNTCTSSLSKTNLFPMKLFKRHSCSCPILGHLTDPGCDHFSNSPIFSGATQFYDLIDNWENSQLGVFYMTSFRGLSSGRRNVSKRSNRH